MEINSVTLIDGTKYKVESPAFSGIIKRIYLYYDYNPEKLLGTEILIQVTKRNNPIHIPYHSVLFYEEKEQ